MSKTPYPSLLKRSEFTMTFGGIYECSPWVAKSVYSLASPGVDVRQMALIMKSVVDAAPRVRKLELVCSHPDLAGRLGLAELSESSQSEQVGAGLDKCQPDELREFHVLNTQYIAKFEFPFIFAVEGYHRTDILKVFRTRVHHTCEEEFEEAIRQVHRIARSRLERMADGI